MIDGHFYIRAHVDVEQSANALLNIIKPLRRWEEMKSFLSGNSDTSLEGQNSS